VGSVATSFTLRCLRLLDPRHLELDILPWRPPGKGLRRSWSGPCGGLQERAGANCCRVMREEMHSIAAALPPLRDGKLLFPSRS
jgi:hypothetical protein